MENQQPPLTVVDGNEREMVPLDKYKLEVEQRVSDDG